MFGLVPRQPLVIGTFEVEMPAGEPSVMINHTTKV